MGNAKPFVDGKTISRYVVEWDGRYLDYRQTQMYGPRFPELFESPKLLLRKRTGENERLIAVFDADHYYCDDTVLVLTYYEFLVNTNAVQSFDGYVRIKPPYPSLKYILALLNSTLYTHLFKLSFATGTLQGSYSDVYPQQVRALPTFSINFQTPDRNRTSPNEESRTIYLRSLVESFTSTRDSVTKQFAALSTRLEDVHDLLVLLADRMIVLNKRKREEENRFLRWVEKVLQILPQNGRTGIESLNGKTILQNYLGDYQKGEKALPWNEFYYYLNKNRRRFGVDLSEVKGEIQAEYEKSLAALLLIKRQLIQTDALIDQIVYRLYGLTDEEITFIERLAYEKAWADAKAAVIANEKLQKDPDAAAEVMAETILPAAEHLVTRIPFHRERQTLDRELPGWHLFHDEVRTFLLTAEHDLNSRLNQPGEFDFSPVIISYAKAVERMLYHKIFIPFRDQERATPADAKNKFLKEFLEGKRKLTLGSMNIILPSSRETALRAYIRKLYPDSDQRFFGPDGIVQRLDDPESLELRNNAAHDQRLSEKDARKVRAWAFDILRKL